MDTTLRDRIVADIEREIEYSKERLEKEKRLYSRLMDDYKDPLHFTSSTVFNLGNIQRQACEIVSIESIITTMEYAVIVINARFKEAQND